MQDEIEKKWLLEVPLRDTFQIYKLLVTYILVNIELYEMKILTGNKKSQKTTISNLVRYQKRFSHFKTHINIGSFLRVGVNSHHTPTTR